MSALIKYDDRAKFRSHPAKNKKWQAGKRKRFSKVLVWTDDIRLAHIRKRLRG